MTTIRVQPGTPEWAAIERLEHDRRQTLKREMSATHKPDPDGGREAFADLAAKAREMLG